MIKRLLAIVRRSIGVGEALFVLGLILLYAGISSLFSHAWAQTACGIILVPVGFILGREDK